MTFKTQSVIDSDHHKGIIALDSIAGGALVVTGKSLTNAQPLHVAMVDGTGSQVSAFSSRANVGSQTTTISNSTAEVTIISAIAATYLDLATIFISNTSVSATRVDIRDASGGTVIFQLFIPADDIRGVSLTTPWPQTTLNNNWTAQSSNSVSDLRVSALYIKNK